MRRDIYKIQRSEYDPTSTYQYRGREVFVRVTNRQEGDRVKATLSLGKIDRRNGKLSGFGPVPFLPDFFYTNWTEFDRDELDLLSPDWDGPVPAVNQALYDAFLTKNAVRLQAYDQFGKPRTTSPFRTLPGHTNILRTMSLEAVKAHQPWLKVRRSVYIPRDPNAVTPRVTNLRTGLTVAMDSFKELVSGPRRFLFDRLVGIGYPAEVVWGYLYGSRHKDRCPDDPEDTYSVAEMEAAGVYIEPEATIGVSR